MRKLMKVIILLTIICTHSVYAGSASSEKAVLNPEDITAFAKSVEKFAASKGARAFIIARQGRPASELPKGMTFTHTAIAVYSAIQLENGETVKGYAIHNLYQDPEKSSRSTLVMDYPVDFFWGANDLKAGIIIPTAELQKRLIESIANGVNAKLHNPKYSMLSNPFNRSYQNCTEHTLDVINAAIYQTADINQLKVNAEAHFKPQRIRKTLKLVLGSIFMDDLTTEDHGRKLYTATFTTIGQYLIDNKLAEDMIVFNQDGSTLQLL